MSYNKYNTRHSGRYNTPGQFVPATEYAGNGSQQQQYTGNAGQQQQTPRPKPAPAPATAQPQVPLQDTDVEMKQEAEAKDETQRPFWMKSKLPGVKKISKKEKRRRQNEHLRRLLVPKNALMVLNEMMLHEQVTNVSNQFKVQLADSAPFFKQNKHNFCADLTLDGNSYKGYGENKMTARNAAAEQAIRDLILKRLAKACEEPEAEPDDALPMIQIASFALHKLFSEWEYEGHKVPQLKPPSASAEPEAAAAAAPRPAAQPKPKGLPLNASAMHPCMLLSYLRPALEYKELAVSGDRPQNVSFTMGVDVDGSTYVGKASNKKEARKQAAKAACAAIFAVRFDEVATANAPVLAATN